MRRRRDSVGYSLGNSWVDPDEEKDGLGEILTWQQQG